MARYRPKDALPAVMGCDRLPSNMTAGKEARVRDLLAAYRKGAVLLGPEPWRLFFETGRFQKNCDKDKTTFVAAIGAAKRVQMCRWQVVGQLDPWLSNRAKEFREAVNGSTLDPGTRRMLHGINRAGAWFTRTDEVMLRDTGEIVPDHIRRLARWRGSAPPTRDRRTPCVIEVRPVVAGYPLAGRRTRRRLPHQPLWLSETTR